MWTITNFCALEDESTVTHRPTHRFEICHSNQGSVVSPSLEQQKLGVKDEPNMLKSVAKSVSLLAAALPQAPVRYHQYNGVNQCHQL